MRRAATIALSALAALSGLGFVAGPVLAADPAPAAHFHSAARSTVTIEDRTGDGAWSAALTYAASEWNRAGVLTLTHRTSSAVGACDQIVRGAIVVCALPQSTLAPYQGKAYHYTDGQGHLYAGRIFVCSDCADDSRKQVIAAHEVGHTLGLGHVDDGRSLMCPSGCAAGPTDEDLARLRANHAHDDAAAGSPPAPAPAPSAPTGRSGGCLLILCF